MSGIMPQRANLCQPDRHCLNFILVPGLDVEVLYGIDTYKPAQLHGVEEPCQYNLDELQGVPLVLLGFLKVREISTNTRGIDIADSRYLCLLHPTHKELEMCIGVPYCFVGEDLLLQMVVDEDADTFIKIR